MQHTHSQRLITPATSAPALADNLARRITVANLRESRVCVCAQALAQTRCHFWEICSACAACSARAEANNVGTMHSTAGAAGQAEKGNEIVMVTMTMTMHRLWPRRCCACTGNNNNTLHITKRRQHYCHLNINRQTKAGGGRQL